MATSNAIMVLPRPVGRTTRVFALEADSAMEFWYSLASMPTGFVTCSLPWRL